MPPSYRIQVPELGIEIIDNDRRISLCAIRNSVVARFALNRRRTRTALNKEIFSALNNIVENNIKDGEGKAKIVLNGEEREVDYKSQEETDEHLKFEKKEVISLELFEFVEFFEFIHNSSSIFCFMEMIRSYEEGSMLRHAAKWAKKETAIAKKPTEPREEESAFVEYVEALETVQGRQFSLIASNFFDGAYDRTFPVHQIVETSRNLLNSISETEETETNITVTFSIEKWNHWKELLESNKFI